MSFDFRKVLGGAKEGKSGQTEPDSRLFDKRMALTVSETAQALGRTPKAIYHLIARDTSFPARKVGGRWVFIPEEIQAWLTKKRRGVTNAS